MHSLRQKAYVRDSCCNIRGTVLMVCFWNDSPGSSKSVKKYPLSCLPGSRHVLDCVQPLLQPPVTNMAELPRPSRELFVKHSRTVQIYNPAFLKQLFYNYHTLQVCISDLLKLFRQFLHIFYTLFIKGLLSHTKDGDISLSLLLDVRFLTYFFVKCFHNYAW